MICLNITACSSNGEFEYFSNQSLSQTVQAKPNLFLLFYFLKTYVQKYFGNNWNTEADYYHQIESGYYYLCSHLHHNFQNHYHCYHH